jgi:O-antigen/teichoic acid export membrane protein
VHWLIKGILTHNALYSKTSSFINNNGAVFLSQVVVSAGNFITSIILARALGLDSFGYFSALWLIILISSSVIMASCIFPMMSNFPKQETLNINKYISGNILLFLSVIFLISIVLIVCLFILSYLDIDIPLFLSLIFTLLAINTQDFFRRLFFTINKSKKALFSDVFTYTFRLLALFILWNYSYLDIYIAFYVCAATAFVGSLLFIKNLPKFDDSYNALKYAYSINIRSAKWLLPSGFMQWTSINLFISMAAFLISPAAVGIIKVCQSLLAVLNILIQGAENIIPLQASRVFREINTQAMWKYLIKVSILGAVPFILLSIICFFFGANILTLFFGDVYQQNGSDVLFIYSIAYVFVYLIVPLRAGLRTIEKTQIWFQAYIASSIVSLSLVYWLEVNFLSLGAVIGILIAHIVLITYTVLVLLRLYNRGGPIVS